MGVADGVSAHEFLFLSQVDRWGDEDRAVEKRESITREEISSSAGRGGGETCTAGDMNSEAVLVAQISTVELGNVEWRDAGVGSLADDLDCGRGRDRKVGLSLEAKGAVPDEQRDLL